MTDVSRRPEWLVVRQGAAPVIVSIPHAGTDLPAEFAGGWVSRWLATKDADWHVEKLYGFATQLDITLVRTQLSRSVIDVNRDPSGKSLYPGMATTELCPTTTFDGEPLYRARCEPDAAEIGRRRVAYFEPYHAALQAEIARLRERHAAVVVFDAHSIRSQVPRLFEGELPALNFGTNSGQSCAPALSDRLLAIAAASIFSCVRDGRFKGGFITRHFGAPARGVHAVQLELACRAYLREPTGPVGERNWPVSFDAAFAEPLTRLLQALLSACVDFAKRAH
jgi:formiminoglutamase